MTLKVYKSLRQEVATLLNHEVMDEGDQEVTFDGRTLPSGVYFYRLTADQLGDDGQRAGRSYIDVRKMILLRQNPMTVEDDPSDKRRSGEEDCLICP